MRLKMVKKSDTKLYWSELGRAVISIWNRMNGTDIRTVARRLELRL